MKIVIATAVYYPMINGVAVFSHNLAKGLAGRGHEVVVLCPSQKGRAYVRTEDGVKVFYLKSTNVKVYPDQVHDTGKKKLWYKHGFHVSVKPGRAVREVLSDFRPDVVHVQVADPIGNAVVAWAKTAGVPVVTTEHNQPEVITEPLGVPGFIKKPVEGILNAYFVNRQSQSDIVTMPTASAIKKLNSGHKKVTTPMMAVSNGVDLTNFKPGRVKKDLYAKYKIEKGVPAVLYVGRVDPEKKVGLVVEAFKAATAVAPKSQLIIVGDGVDKARIKKQVAADGLADKVHLLGRVVGEDLYEIYKMGWVFATASEIETQGIVLIEAAAVGLPLIAVDAGAVSEVCVDNVNGFLCAPGDVPAISSAMTKILSDDNLRLRLAKASLKIAKTHDFEKTLDQYIKIYRQVIKR